MIHNRNGNLTVNTALTLPWILFGFLALIDLLLYYLGMVEISFVTSQVAEDYRSGLSLSQIQSTAYFGFSSMCLLPDGSIGHSIAIDDYTAGSMIWQAVSVTCEWDFLFMDTLFPSFNFPKSFQFDVIVGPN